MELLILKLQLDQETESKLAYKNLMLLPVNDFSRNGEGIHIF